MRVRTFIAIWYWLLTFFVMDFLPVVVGELAEHIGQGSGVEATPGWIGEFPLCNGLVIDAKLARSQSIVRNLVKVVKDRKEAHTRCRSGTSSAHQSIPTETNVLGETFAEAISKDQDDSDAGPDFAPEGLPWEWWGIGERVCVCVWVVTRRCATAQGQRDRSRIDCHSPTTPSVQYSPTEPSRYFGRPGRGAYLGTVSTAQDVSATCALSRVHQDDRTSGEVKTCVGLATDGVHGDRCPCERVGV